MRRNIFLKAARKGSRIKSSGEAGFTLLELLTSMTVLALLTGMMMPAFVQTGKARDVGRAARMVSNLLESARTEAITHRTVTRMVVASNWAGNPAANFRKVSVWRNDSSAGWKQVSRWEELPASIACEPTAPAYVPDSTPANYLLGGSANTFTSTVGGNAVDMLFVEFLPSGAARMPQAPGPEVWLTLAPGTITDGAMVHQAAGGTPPNWAKISANTLSGRLKITQP